MNTPGSCTAAGTAVPVARISSWHRLRISILHTFACGLLCISTGAATADENTLGAALDEQMQADRESRQSQAQIDRLSEETAAALAEYRLAGQSLDRVRIYNEHLSAVVEDQEREKASVARQLEYFVEIEQEIVPLMMRMIDDLARLVELDLPFQLAERQARIGNLRSLMNRSDVTISEKYRRIMEAYKIEADFGRDMEHYSATLVSEGQTREVDFLRVGRVFLGYQTRDRQEAGFWDSRAGEGGWRVDNRFRQAIERGIRIARKQAAPDLLSLPVRTPEAVR